MSSYTRGYKTNSSKTQKAIDKMSFGKKHVDEGEHASLINAERLAQKQKRDYALAEAAEKIEKKLSRTGESLQILGAGKPHGNSNSQS